MNCTVIPVTPFQQNCSLIWCEKSRQAALVDPGGEAELLLEQVEKEGLTLAMVLLTHGHIDHVGAAEALRKACDIPVLGPHQADAFWLESLPQQAEMFGFPTTEPFTPDRWLEAGETITMGELALQVIHCPGHTPGHLVFFEPRSRTAFVGDVLFKGSVGRSDLAGGSHRQLLQSIHERLMPLGDEVTVIPGHGALTTLGEERLHNPFLQDDD